MRNKGFTLIELVVVIAILGFILAATITLINPAKQVQKAQLAQKESDIEQIKTALDLYYDDNKCYPASLQFGSSWTGTNGTVYMEYVPNSSNSKEPYTYEVSGNCPQWYVLYAKYSVRNSALSANCPLKCHPPDDVSNHICVYGGIVDCTYISGTPLGD